MSESGPTVWVWNIIFETENLKIAYSMNSSLNSSTHHFPPATMDKRRWNFDLANSIAWVVFSCLKFFSEMQKTLL